MVAGEGGHNSIATAYIVFYEKFFLPTEVVGRDAIDTHRVLISEK